MSLTMMRGNTARFSGTNAPDERTFETTHCGSGSQLVVGPLVVHDDILGGPRVSLKLILFFVCKL